RGRRCRDRGRRRRAQRMSADQGRPAAPTGVKPAEPEGSGPAGEATDAAAVEHDIEELAQLDPSATLQAERDELRSLAQRVQADFENYRKRVLREQTALVDRASERLVEQLLPVLDSFELALANLHAVDDGVRKGVELVYAELVAVLERAGLQRV